MRDYFHFPQKVKQRVPTDRRDDATHDAARGCHLFKSRYIYTCFDSSAESVSQRSEIHYSDRDFDKAGGGAVMGIRRRLFMQFKILIRKPMAS